ncbi:hypothetical protein Hanom_Chr04g00315671 [Helianthus anomalus]
MRHNFVKIFDAFFSVAKFRSKLATFLVVSKVKEAHPPRADDVAPRWRPSLWGWTSRYPLVLGTKLVTYCFLLTISLNL